MERQVSFDVIDYYPDGDGCSSDLVSHIDHTSGPSSPIHKNPKMKSPEDSTDYVTVTLDISEDGVFVYSVTPAGDFGPSVEVQMLPKPAVTVRRRAYEPSRMKFDSSEALKGLKMFISMTDAGWMAVENRFNKMTAKTDGLLLRSSFGECVGINSKRFATELFDALARRRYIACEVINKCELREFWEEINDQRFDTRLEIFFDMADKDGDCRLTIEEVREFIRLTASANNQSITQETENEYAALIMEELDPDNIGYINKKYLEWLLIDVETFSEKTTTETIKKPSKRWYRVSYSSLIPFLKKRASKKKHDT